MKIADFSLQKATLGHWELIKSRLNSDIHLAKESLAILENDYSNVSRVVTSLSEATECIRINEIQMVTYPHEEES